MDLLVIIALTCSPTKVLPNGITLTNRDIKEIKIAKQTCFSKYRGCLDKFIKIESGVYYAICKKPN